ncbi:hypothetical protein AB4406_11790 [Vibrio splendidus]
MATGSLKLPSSGSNTVLSLFSSLVKQALGLPPLPLVSIGRYLPDTGLLNVVWMVWLGLDFVSFRWMALSLDKWLVISANTLECLRSASMFQTFCPCLALVGLGRVPSLIIRLIVLWDTWSNWLKHLMVSIISQ